ncbi:MAG: hypothetical protein JSU61_04290 [Fidelibacterota bacterium]|nr:MAG: hypothetical protein JSU61_04290 [Candidatus Neomarinimicrobiota bacterium]
MDIPTDLKHKPVMVSREYDRVDGRQTPASDAKGLSLGLAQWNDRGKVDISAKIWRHTGGKWSRQSEEMPLHRVLDLALLICRTRLYFANRYRTPDADYPNFPDIDRIPLQGGALNVAVCTENEFIEQDLDLFDGCLHQDDEIISERLTRLAALLKELGY